MKYIPSLITVVLGLPRNKSVAHIIVRTSAIIDALEANKTMFPSPTPATVQAKAHIADLTSTEAAFQNRTGTLAARNDACALVVADAHQLHVYVQQLVNADPRRLRSSRRARR